MALVRGASSLLAVLLVVAALALSVSEVDAQLTYRYYRPSCPNVEQIVFKEVQKAFKKDPTIAPGVLRLMFHDCFVRVSIAPLLPSTKTSHNIWKSSLSSNY